MFKRLPKRVVWLIGLLFQFLFSEFAYLQAQEATEISIPTSDVIYFWESQSLFPVGVGFDIVIARPQPEIARATLIVQPEGRETQEIDVSIAENTIFSETFTELTYIWSIPQGAPIGVFTEIDYTWRVVTNRDEIAEVSSKLVFTDTRVEWQTNEDTNGMIDLTAPSEGINTAALRSSVRDVYHLLETNTGRSPRFNLLIYPATLPVGGCIENANGQAVVIETKGGKEAPCDVLMAENAIRAAGYSLLQIPSPTTGISEQTILIEHLVGEFYAPIWNGKNVPDWFRVGLARFYAPIAKGDLLAPVRQAGRNNQLISLQGMTTSPSFDNSEVANLWRAQSYGMVLYVAQQIGVQGMFDLANEIGNAESFEAAYQKVMGASLTTLLPAWQNWIFKEAAVSAYSYYPYLPDTPTPTSTRTHTPTITPTATGTFTETPTPTVTGVLSATSLPTFTPSITPKPPTPTLTPRPAGSSIDTPTPLPSPTPTPTAFTLDPGLGFGIVGIVFLLLGLLSFAYLRVTSRR
jgi:hypothetical protein